VIIQKVVIKANFTPILVMLTVIIYYNIVIDII